MDLLKDDIFAVYSARRVRRRHRRHLRPAPPHPSERPKDALNGLTHHQRQFSENSLTLGIWSMTGGGPFSSPYTSTTSNRKFPCQCLRINQLALALSRFRFFRLSIRQSRPAKSERALCVFTSTNITLRSSGSKAMISISHRRSFLHGRSFLPTIRQPSPSRCSAATPSPQRPRTALPCATVAVDDPPAPERSANLFMKLRSLPIFSLLCLNDATSLPAFSPVAAAYATGQQKALSTQHTTQCIRANSKATSQTMPRDIPQWSPTPIP